MAQRLGDMLVQEGVITPEALEEALRYQVIYGGKIGTNLIEMGLVEEGDIALALSRKLGVPYVDPDQLMAVPPDLLTLLPKEMVERYRVIPYRLERKKLSLVMLNPADLAAIDDISFRTGFLIRPLVAPEVRMVLALERFYGIKRELRYIQASNVLLARAKKPARKAAAPAQPSRPDPRLAELADIDLAEIDEVLELADAELIEESAPVPEIVTAHSLAGIAEALAFARDRDQIAGAIIDYLGQQFQRCALFLIREGMAAGWKGSHQTRPLEGFELFQLPLDNPSVLKLVAESRSFFLGPVPPTPENQTLLAALGGDGQRPVILVPLLMLGRVVAVLYAEGAENINERLSEIQKLAAKAALAFDILILRNKITML